jgi:predicted dehydrogenase
MNNPAQKADVSRRHFIKSSSLVVAGAAVAPYVITSHAAPDDPIKIGLVGCGGRGSGAIRDAYRSSKGVELVAVADIFPERAKACREALNKESHNIKEDMVFSGFDAYKQLLAVPEINYVILATPPGFRPIHFPAAIEAGKNVFMEKPVATDGPGIRAVIEAGEKAAEKGLAVVAGTQRRHQNVYRETIKRIHDGAIGEILCLQAYWNQGLIWNHPWKDDVSDMENQLRNWYHYVWLCGDHIVEQHVHNLDVANWVMNDHPIKAYGRGGRQVLKGRGQIYDHFVTEFTYKNGAKLMSQCSQIAGCTDRVSEFVIGTNGTSDPGGSIRVNGWEGWRPTVETPNPYVVEHADNIAAIREGKPLNEARRVAESTLTAIMGREASYSGHEINWETALNSTMNLQPEKFEFGPLPAAEVAIPGKHRFA